MALFNYTGSNPSQPASYTLHTDPNPPTCPGATEQMCSLQAANNGSDKPVITDSLKDEIINCLQNQVNSTNVKLKER